MLEFAPLHAWAGILRHHRVDRRFALRAATSLGMSVATTPLRLYESLRYGRVLRRTAIHAAPVFVVGCARSGTTHLHNLLAQDRQFCFVSNFQAIFQAFALSGSTWLQPLLERRGPGKRPMDNVALDMSGPQEEDFAIASCSRHSGLHCNTFPRDFDELFRAYVLGEFDQRTRAAWEAAYRGVLRKATLAGGGRRLVLKSPTNTGRIPVLREMFPGARFIHIHRNPYRVLQSLESAARKVLPMMQLQDIGWDAVQANLVRSYEVLMRKLLDDRRPIPESHFVEVRFEDLEAHPLRELERIYAKLDLCQEASFEQTRPRIVAYLERLGDYQKNAYEASDRVINCVNDNWAFAVEALGYERLQPGVSSPAHPRP